MYYYVYALNKRNKIKVLVEAALYLEIFSFHDFLVTLCKFLNFLFSSNNYFVNDNNVTCDHTMTEMNNLTRILIAHQGPQLYVLFFLCSKNDPRYRYSP